MLTNSLNLYLICPFILLQLHLLVHTLLLLGVLITLLWTAGFCFTLLALEYMLDFKYTLRGTLPSVLSIVVLLDILVDLLESNADPRGDRGDCGDIWSCWLYSRHPSLRSHRS